MALVGPGAQTAPGSSVHTGNSSVPPTSRWTQFSPKQFLILIAPFMTSPAGQSRSHQLAESMLARLGVDPAVVGQAWSDDQRRQFVQAASGLAERHIAGSLPEADFDAGLRATFLSAMKTALGDAPALRRQREAALQRGDTPGAAHAAQRLKALAAHVTLYEQFIANATDRGAQSDVRIARGQLHTLRTRVRHLAPPIPAPFFLKQ